MSSAETVFPREVDQSVSAAAVGAGPLTAGGTVASRPLKRWRRVELWCELVLLYIAAPLAMFWAVQWQRVPVFIALLPAFFIAFILLLGDRNFRLTRELTTGFSWRAAAGILLVFVIFGGAATLWVTNNHPSWFMEFPRNRPETYQRIMLLYPLFSVVAQELVYRTLYFHRYGRLFGEHHWIAIALNGILFGFAHIVVASEVAVIGTVLGGFLFAIRYAWTRSFWAVFIEHTIWGWLIFTIGLGRFFFSGVSNL